MAVEITTVTNETILYVKGFRLAFRKHIFHLQINHTLSVNIIV